MQVAVAGRLKRGCDDHGPGGRIDGNQLKIKEQMEVGAEENPVVDTVCLRPHVGPNVSCFKGNLSVTSRDRATILVRAQEGATELGLALPLDNGSEHPRSRILLIHGAVSAVERESRDLTRGPNLLERGNDLGAADPVESEGELVLLFK